MADLQATCHTPDNNDADRRIQGLGGHGWRYSVDDIIRHIEGRVHTYWTRVNGVRANIEVKTRPNGRKYLKTTADGYEPNNLLALPRCS